MTIVAGIIIFIIGLAIGFAVDFFWLRKLASDNKIAKELEETKTTFEHYQMQVGAHITKTADLLEKVHNDYQQVQEHIFHGAQQLNLQHHTQSALQPTTHYMPHQTAAIKAEAAKKISSAAAKHDKSSKTTIKAQKVKPPKDYANGD